MVQGETLEELEASFASAQALVAKVRESVLREQERTRPSAPIVPARCAGPHSHRADVRARKDPRWLAGLASMSGNADAAQRFPGAEWVPWQLHGEGGEPTCWPGENEPAAVVLHIMAGYAHTARDWATAGHVGASWHFTVARDGSAMQHLELSDAGWHAGIPAVAPVPPWTLWRGPGQNVNRYTIGIEHEGFPGQPFTAAQTATSIALCRWLASTLGFPFDRAHFPAHADIDIINRPNDFNTPPLREQHYAALLGAGEPALAQAPGAVFGSLALDPRQQER